MLSDNKVIEICYNNKNILFTLISVINSTFP